MFIYVYIWGGVYYIRDWIKLKDTFYFCRHIFASVSTILASVCTTLAFGARRCRAIAGPRREIMGSLFPPICSGCQSSDFWKPYNSTTLNQWDRRTIVGLGLALYMPTVLALLTAEASCARFFTASVHPHKNLEKVIYNSEKGLSSFGYFLKLTFSMIKKNPS